MAEEGLSVAAETAAAAAAASPSPLDLKRKLGDLEAEEAPAEQAELSESNGGDVESADSDEAGAKRPRLDDKPDASAGENGHQEENADEGKNEDDDKPQSEEVSGKVTEEKPAKDSQPQDSTEEQENQPHPSQDHQPGDDHCTEQDQPTSDSGIVTRRMEIPNNKVGVLIGKSGDTIKYLQYNSGAKIQITKDVDSDPHSTTRPVEMVGTLDSVKKAEKLINAVIAEADAGGSPSLVARGLGVSQAAAEQIEIQVPNEKVGVIIGKGGETIKGLQTRSGARIQLIPQHLPEGDESKERTVRVTGDKRQIETAREMIKEVMNQMRPSSFSGGFNQQGYRPRGPPGPHQWGPRGHHMGHPSSYDYPQRGPYSSHNQQYPPYRGYPQQMGPRSGYNSGGWEQRPPPSMHQHGGGGYDYYGGQKSHFPEPGHAQHSAPPHAPPGPSPNPAMGPPHSQQSYNYGQHQGPDYGNSGPYSQSAHHQQSYGQGYDDHAPPQHHYGGSQPYTHAGAPTGYGPAQHYGKPPYGMQSQAPPPQSYGPPRPNQSTDAPYQGSAPAQSYGQNVPPQQPYSYASTAPAQQQNYPPPYGSAPAPAASADGYNQAPAASAPSYPQQGTQPVASYGQSGTQTAPTYAQAGPAAAYGQYPSQQGYADQSAANAAAYGYQGSQDPAVYGAAAPASAYGVAPPAGQQLVYAAQATTQAQQSYDQSGSQQAGTYGVQPSTSAGYGGKTVSPQPGYAQYDSTQMYAAPH